MMIWIHVMNVRLVHTTHLMMDLDLQMVHTTCDDGDTDDDNDGA